MWTIQDQHSVKVSVNIMEPSHTSEECTTTFIEILCGVQLCGIIPKILFASLVLVTVTQQTVEKMKRMLIG